jgi:hypothetical protein
MKHSQDRKVVEWPARSVVPSGMAARRHHYSRHRAAGRAISSALLALAERDIAAIDQQISRQRRIVEKLRKIGAETWGAQSLLNEFQEIRRLHVRNRDRLLGIRIAPRGPYVFQTPRDQPTS